MKNQEIAKIFQEMAFLLEIKDIPFKPSAYQRAGYSIGALEKDIEEIYKQKGAKGLLEIPAVGSGIAERIEEYLKTGKINDYEKLKKEFPVDLEGLSSIEGVGPKHIKLFYQRLGVKNLADLERAAKEGRLKNLPRMGEKLEQRILQSVEFHKKYRGRFLLGDVLVLAEKIEERLKKIKGVKRAVGAGSLRRHQETIGDLDFLVVSETPERVMDYFVSMPEVERILAKGPTKTMVKLKSGIDADLRVLPPESFGSALQYFTGNKEHNILLRQLALKKGYKLSEYGLFKGERRIAGKTEEEIYEKLDLQWIPPELRSGKEEIEFAGEKKLPRLIEFSDVLGDLQTHTTWSEGANSIEEMAEEAKKMGYQYLAITDHTKALAMTHGADEKKLLRQMKEIDKLNSKFQIPNSKFRVLKGAELNIMKDGSVDIKNNVLEKLDVAGAAIHHQFNLSEEEQTRRIIRAMENPHIDVIYHLTGRLIQKREPLRLNLRKIFQKAAETKTLLEINAYPSRLDLKDEHIKEAKKFGCKFVIDTDAHITSELHFMNYGTMQARRGWLEKKDVLNALALNDFLEVIKKPKEKRWQRNKS